MISGCRRCSRCGKPAEIRGPDPFLEEVFPEDAPAGGYEDEDWCRGCWDDRKDEV